MMVEMEMRRVASMLSLGGSGDTVELITAFFKDRKVMSVVTFLRLPSRCFRAN